MHETQSSSSPPLSPEPVTLHSRGFAVMGGMLLLLAAGIALIVSAALLDGGPASEGAWVGFLVAGCAGVFGYLLGFHPRLRLSEEGIELRGVLSTTFVPWSQVLTLDAEGRGQLVIGLVEEEGVEGEGAEGDRKRSVSVEGGGGRRVGHFHYGASLGGELIRYRHHRRVARRIEAFREQVGQGAVTDSAAGSRTTLPVVPVLCVLLLFQVPLVVIFALSLG